MTKIICYAGCVREYTIYLYNPQSKQVITRNGKGEIVRVHNLIDYKERSLEKLDKLYSAAGMPIEIEESNFEELCEKADQLKDLHNEINNLAKKLFSIKK